MRKLCVILCGCLCLYVASAEAVLDIRPEIAVGMSAAFKGSSRSIGIELYRGSRAYFDVINSSGGINGRNIKLIAYDDSYSPIPAVANTVRLIEKDKAFLLFGYVGTATVIRVLPLLKVYSEQNLTMFFPLTGAQPQRQAPYDAFTFNLRPSYRQEVQGLVDNFVNVGRKKIGVFYQIDAYGRSGWDATRKALASHDLKIVSESTYRRGASFEADMKQQVEILKDAGVDAVICVGAYAASAAFIRDARDAGWEVPIANLSFAGSEAMLSLLLGITKANGREYVHDLVNTQVVPSFEDTSIPAVRQYRSVMERMDRYGAVMPPEGEYDPDYEALPFGFVSFEGFLNAKLLVEVLRRLGPELDRANLRTVTQGIEEFNLGIVFPATFGPESNQALDKVYFMTVEGDRWVALKQWDWEWWQKKQGPTIPTTTTDTE